MCRRALYLLLLAALFLALLAHQVMNASDARNARQRRVLMRRGELPRNNQPDHNNATQSRRARMDDAAAQRARDAHREQARMQRAAMDDAATQRERDANREQHRMQRASVGGNRFAKICNIDHLQEDSILAHQCANRDKVCPHCCALYWPEEVTVAGTYTTCCSNGAVKLDDVAEPPQFLKALFEGNDSQSRHFQNNARVYNNALSFASLSMTNETVRQSNGRTCPIAALRISGQLHCNISSIANTERQLPCWSQVR